MLGWAGAGCAGLGLTTGSAIEPTTGSSAGAATPPAPAEAASARAWRCLAKEGLRNASAEDISDVSFASRMVWRSLR